VNKRVTLFCYTYARLSDTDHRRTSSESGRWSGAQRRDQVEGHETHRGNSAERTMTTN